MSEKLTHWQKTRDTNYLGSWDIMDGDHYSDIVLTIASVGTEKVLDPSTNRQEEKTVMHFSEKTYKPMILNTTNKKAIQSATGTPFIERWVGHKIKIGVEKVKAFESVHDAQRISPVPVVINKKKCECCGKEITEAIFNGTKAKCGFGVCSEACRDQMVSKNGTETVST